MRAAFGALKWSPQQFWSSTLTEFLEALHGLAEANGAEEPLEAPSELDLDDLVAKYG